MSTTKKNTRDEELVATVRDRYGRMAKGSRTGCCGGPETTRALTAESIGYRSQELEKVPEGANLGLGCGAPVEALELKTGETVLDLGSGAGIDVFLAARRVGPSGRAIGVDMTPEMIERAEENARKSGLDNVEFLQGRLESLPLGDESVDAVTSNCVINLVPDKREVFREIARVLRPGGRMVISDIMLDAPLPEAVEKSLLAYVGCVAGAALRPVYFEQVTSAGLGKIEVLHDVDYIAAVGGCYPDDVRAWIDEAGIDVDALSGTVRSITFRALKPR